MENDFQSFMEERNEEIRKWAAQLVSIIDCTARTAAPLAGDNEISVLGPLGDCVQDILEGQGFNACYPHYSTDDNSTERVPCYLTGECKTPKSNCPFLRQARLDITAAPAQDIAVRLEQIRDDDSLCERFAEVLLEEIRTDDESLVLTGRHVIDSYKYRDVDEAIMALSGWSIQSIINRM